ncbi:hypothetical protein JOB18_008611 [Solea senegalensis]|uniref:Uncharacterized protein n=1 Tax=Solea senegalensis TaxID=28829 RepID=A0AAV6SDF2_SOLSE|nr:hypothetical protein JOB18_008611 [Solea senegalensis]
MTRGDSLDEPVASQVSNTKLMFTCQKLFIGLEKADVLKAAKCTPASRDRLDKPSTLLDKDYNDIRRYKFPLILISNACNWQTYTRDSGGVIPRCLELGVHMDETEHKHKAKRSLRN